MAGLEHLKKDIRELGDEFNYINKGSGLKKFATLIDMCRDTKDPEKTLKEIKEEFGEGSFLDLGIALLSSVQRNEENQLFDRDEQLKILKEEGYDVGD